MTATDDGRELTVILGQHRTGTSALAGALDACGLDFGPADKTSTQHNERGHFENPAVTFLNEALLTPWTLVPSIGPIHEDLRDSIFAQYHGPRIGLKSREALYVLPFWSRAVGGMRLVATLRHPLGFARSYQRRSVLDASSRGLDADRFVPGLEPLFEDWRSYYANVLALRRRVSFPIVDFDLPFEQYLGQLEKVTRALGFDYSDDQVRRFVSDSLRHHMQNDALPPLIAELYEELRRFAGSTSTAAALKTQEIADASVDVKNRYEEPPHHDTIFVGWQNAHTGLAEAMVQVQQLTSTLAERVAHNQRERTDFLRRADEAQTAYANGRAELLAKVDAAQAEFASQRAALLSKFTDAQGEFARQRDDLLQRFTEAQLEYGRQRHELLQVIQDRESQLARQKAAIDDRTGQPAAQFVVWLTGVPGSGKTTIASLLIQRLRELGVRTVLLDGDELRARLSPELGFTRPDRDLHVSRTTFIAGLLKDAGVIPIVALVSPFRAARAEARRALQPFIEVHLECPIEVLRQRDPKGLYRAAAAGTVSALTGVDDPYEPPIAPELRIDTSTESPTASVNHVFRYLLSAGYVQNHAGHESAH